MLARNLIRLYLSDQWHGVKNNWDYKPQHYAALRIKAQHLLAIYKAPLPKDSLAPICCCSCLAVGTTEQIPYGKLLPYCPACLSYNTDTVLVDVRGNAWRSLLLKTLWPHYNAFEAEYIICTAIQEIKLENKRKIANPPNIKYNPLMTLQQRLERSPQ